MAYCGYVVRIGLLRKHENADRLQIATVFGNDVVVGLNVYVGDMMIYFPTDGQLSYDFAYKNELLREDKDGNKMNGYMDAKKRNIKAIRLRGEKSDGLLVPVESLSYLTDVTKFEVGEKIDVVNGEVVCQKYIPAVKNQGGKAKAKNKKAEPKESYPFFNEHKDTAQLAYSLRDFKEDDLFTVSLKMHGTSARTSNALKEVKPSLLQKLFRIKPRKSWGAISGSRRVVLNNYDGGFYGSNEFRKEWHDFFAKRLHKGETVYYEIVGYVREGTPIMVDADNTKMNDKEFVKKYGKTTRFSYGCEDGTNDVYVYRMTMTNEDGEVVEYPTWKAQVRCEEMGVKHVPVLMQGIFDNSTALMHDVEGLMSGPDPIGKTHIREGVVARIENRSGFVAYKAKSFEFKVLEGIIKENATEPDMEEAQEVIA